MFWITIGFAVIVGIAGIVIAGEAFDVEKLTAVNIPVSVVWFGLLVAVLCSLQGIIQHNDDFDPSFNYWHVARPLTGASVGLMSYLLLAVLVTLGGSTPPSSVPVKAVDLSGENPGRRTLYLIVKR